MEKEQRSNVEFIPQFEKSFLLPKYWGAWVGVGTMVAMAYLPVRLEIRSLLPLGAGLENSQVEHDVVQELTCCTAFQN